MKDISFWNLFFSLAVFCAQVPRTTLYIICALCIIMSLSNEQMSVCAGAAERSPVAGAVDGAANGGGAPVPAARPAGAARVHPGGARCTQDLVCAAMPSSFIQLAFILSSKQYIVSHYSYSIVFLSILLASRHVCALNFIFVALL